MAEDTPPKLKMDHGFMRSIIKNQVERDEYDKEVRLQKTDLQKKPARQPRANRRAPMQVYTPPGKRLTQTAENISDQAVNKPEKNVAFRLEFIDNDENVSSLLVYEGDDPKSLSETFAKEIGLDSVLQNALYHRIKEEMAQETDKR